MSAIQRSRSAPHVAPTTPFLLPKTREPRASPRIRRHHTSLALTDLPAKQPSRSGYQTPRADDPFSLGGFFPSQLPESANSDADWQWLRTDDADSDLDRFSDFDHPAYGPGSDDDDDDDELPRVIFDKSEDLRTGQTILNEDKLGVLSLLPAIFTSGASCVESQSASVIPAYDRLLSPYCEDNPLDDDAVYQSWSALREAHALSLSPPRVLAKLDGCSGSLFSPVEDAREDSTYEEDGSWQSMLSQGVGMVLDLLAF